LWGRPVIARILVVDDSITVAKFTEMMLSDQGHEIIFAMDGVECIQKLNSRAVDLIILDVVMPGKNGYQLCREIKTNSRFGNIPIIMMTTKGQESDKFWGMRQGADAYLVKPCAEKDLINTVNKYVPALIPEDVVSASPDVTTTEVEAKSEIRTEETVQADTIAAQAVAPLTAEVVAAVTVEAVSSATEEVVAPATEELKFEEEHLPPAEPSEKGEAHPSDRKQDAFYSFGNVFEQELKKEKAPELVESAAAPLSQANKASTGELPVLPKEETIKKKPLSLRERLQKSFYRFSN
jgi:CheY-like chemotaxis protein